LVTRHTGGTKKRTWYTILGLNACSAAEQRYTPVLNEASGVVGFQFKWVIVTKTPAADVFPIGFLIFGTWVTNGELTTR